MNKELAILQLADYKEFFENGGSSCYLIINNKRLSVHVRFC